VSDNNSTNGQTALPEPQAAFDLLFQNVHSEVFFGKLASAGVSPRNQKEASDMLELAGRLRVLEEDPRVQKAAQVDSPYARMIADLDEAMAANGLDSGVKAAADREYGVAVNQAAARLMQDPNIYNSVLSVKAAQARMLQ
jgi:hypothetical protein